VEGSGFHPQSCRREGGRERRKKGGRKGRREEGRLKVEKQFMGCWIGTSKDEKILNTHSGLWGGEGCN
jgi:hypothetical protein